MHIPNTVTMKKDEKYVLPTEDKAIRFNPRTFGNMRAIEGNDPFISNKDKGKIAMYFARKWIGDICSTGWACDANFFDAENDTDDDL